MNLEQFRRFHGYNPYHFWGMSNSKCPVSSACNTVVYEYAWQKSDAINRHAIREALARAKNLIYQNTGWPIERTWISRLVPYPQLADKSMRRIDNTDITGRRLAIRLPDGYIRQLGSERLELLTSGTPALTDNNNDGLLDTFTLTVNVGSNIPETSIEVYFQDADVPEGKRKVEPVSVSIVNGTATITGKSWLLVRPILYEKALPEPLDPDDTSIYAQILDIYRHDTKTDGQTEDDCMAVLYWETLPYPDCAVPTNQNSADPAALASAIARGAVRDARHGFVTVGESVFDTTTSQWVEKNWSANRPPDRVLIRYEAGVQQTDAVPGQNRRWDDIVIMLATAELPERDWGCDIANKSLYHYQFDLARAAGDEQFRIGNELLANPLGTKRGQLEAWRAIVSEPLRGAIML
ncbi:MAG: hypothetical protein D6706_16635 [Chloroflexi bacterium]|nr:MAG: hypothetical protein D6706_16635 [Chloroflexota bacterium]